MRRSGFGSSRFGAAIAAAALAVVLGGIAFSPAGAADPPPVPSIYNAITPCRLIDTRPAPDTVGPRTAPLGALDTFTISALPPAGPCAIPTTATALQLNVTATGATAVTFLTLWPANATRPNASNLNPTPGAAAVPNAVTVALSPIGQFNVFNLAGSVNVIVDVVGYFDNAAAAARAANAPAIIFSPGTATSIPAFACIAVLATGGALNAADAGKVVTGYITDSGGVNPPLSINNATIFKAGTVFKTSQGGAIGFVEVCNPTAQDKALPQGWRLIGSVKP